MSTCKNKGLCSTCTHEATCTYARAHQGPIFYCEEFEALGLESRSNVIELPQVQATPKGLCANCSNRETCMTQGSGLCVWYCEQYA